jgi:hypothetical protein
MFRESARAVQITYIIIAAASLLSAAYSVWRGDVLDVLVCLSIPAVPMVLKLAGRRFGVRLPNCMWIFIMLFNAIGSLGGSIYDFYHYFTYWDDLMHIICGMLAAFVGFAAPDALDRQHSGEHSMAIKVFSALTFIFIWAAIWEFYEYAFDTFLGTDMQTDSIVHIINSAIIGPDPIIVDSITDITDVTVNGQSLGLGGYLDIGLHDSMTDMLGNAIGGVLYCNLALIPGKFRRFFERNLAVLPKRQ